MRISLRLALFVAALALLSACKEEVAQSTTPQDMTPETLGHYCQMNLLEHPGPKAQVFLEGNAAPLFFSQVRDAVAYMRGPEQVAPILAVYVNDMGEAGATWDRPGDGNWIAADKAFYVLGSARAGGMGAPEAVPFSSRERAEDFVLAEGGRVLTLADITDDMVLAPVQAGEDQADDADADFDGRLRALPNKAGG
ncbi:MULTISPECIES: nitrous oxide reductase accessory protein NosL [Shinella]|uniref:Nitrous oxide reductase accessory protein NosL n=1 Tax=Shinella sedimenti TaxID=2919913 RepID=A0ABT0CSV3_9HYPH|nr:MULTISPECIES: nitrous oxide reductase accessory protein NosL [Shinella]MCJ8151684.1 nitrous oxide reductase accessory protein NosL [Shinella sedimenti]